MFGLVGHCINRVSLLQMSIFGQIFWRREKSESRTIPACVLPKKESYDLVHYLGKDSLVGLFSKTLCQLGKGQGDRIGPEEPFANLATKAVGTADN